MEKALWAGLQVGAVAIGGLPGAIVSTTANYLMVAGENPKDTHNDVVDKAIAVTAATYGITRVVLGKSFFGTAIQLGLSAAPLLLSKDEELYVEEEELED